MASRLGTEALPPGVFSDGTRLWRAKPGATSSFDESCTARALFVDLHHDQFWNPWRMEEEAAALERAEVVMEEWARAEPDFVPMTDNEIEADHRRWQRECERAHAEQEVERQHNLERYDAEREQARLALFENRSILDCLVTELARFRSGEAFPAMDAGRRAQKVSELEESVSRRRIMIAELTVVVGDPEDVPDRNGWLPADRRVVTRHYYERYRIEQIVKLRAELSNIDNANGSADDKGARLRLGRKQEVPRAQLEKLLAVPRLEAEDMCADCPTPWASHGYGSMTGLDDGPCSAWPEWAARLRTGRRVMEDAARHRSSAEAQSPASPKPEPLATVPSGLSIAQMVNMLQELQSKYPDSDVRQGRGKRWELWPRDAT